MSEFIQFVEPALLVVAFVSGMIVGEKGMSSDWQRAAIERGFGEYDSKTGKWKWKEPMT